MNFHTLDLNLLVALDALLEERNVTKAAERMYMSQSAMSHALARLRKYFDDPLFVRVGHRLRPTPRAEALVEPVHDILLRIQATLEESPEFRPDDATNHFVLGMTEYTGLVVLPRLMPLLRQLAPCTQITVRDADVEAELGLAQGLVDLLISRPRDLSYPSIELFQDDFVCTMAMDHPTVTDGITLEAFASTPYAVYLGGRDVHDQVVEAALLQHGLSRPVTLRVANLSALPEVLAETDILAIMPRRYFAHVCRYARLRCCDLPFAFPPNAPRMYWHESKADDPAHRWLRNLLLDVKQVIADEDPPTNVDKA